MLASLAVPLPPMAAWRIDMTENPRIAPDSDGGLMQRVARGDHGAYAALVDRHLRHAVTLAWRVLFDRADAEEVAQEAFLRVWQHAARWQPDGSATFRTWLNRIVVNLCIDRKRRPGMAALEDQAEPVDPQPGPFETRLHAETSDRVAAALQRLPERQRAAILLCYWEGESNIAAAETLGITVGALESLLVRAKRALRDDLNPSLGSQE